MTSNLRALLFLLAFCYTLRISMTNAKDADTTITEERLLKVKNFIDMAKDFLREESET